MTARLVAVLFALAALSSCRAHVALEAFERWHHNLSPAPASRADDARVEGVCTEGSLNWIVPVGGNDVVIVDAGFEESATTLTRAVGARHLLAVLLTHGHADHTAGARALAVPVYVGADDLAALEGRFRYTAWVPALLWFAATTPPPRSLIREVHDGDEIVLGDKRFTAVAMPGHTPGSTAWLVDELAFTGDAAQSPLGDEVWPAPGIVSEDMDRAYASMKKLLAYPFDTLFDAHYGKLAHAHAAVARAVARQRTEQPSDRPAGCGQP